MKGQVTPLKGAFKGTREKPLPPCLLPVHPKVYTTFLHIFLPPQSPQYGPHNQRGQGIWIEISEIISQNTSFFLFRCLCHAFCHRDKKINRWPHYQTGQRAETSSKALPQTSCTGPQRRSLEVTTIAGFQVTLKQEVCCHLTPHAVDPKATGDCNGSQVFTC